MLTQTRTAMFLLMGLFAKFLLLVSYQNALGQTILTTHRFEDKSNQLATFLKERSGLSFRVVVAEGNRFFDDMKGGKADFFVTDALEIVTLIREHNFDARKDTSNIASIGEVVLHLISRRGMSVESLDDLRSPHGSLPNVVSLDLHPTREHAHNAINALRAVKNDPGFECARKISCRYDTLAAQEALLMQGKIRAFFVTSRVPIPSLIPRLQRREMHIAAISPDVTYQMWKEHFGAYTVREINPADYRATGQQIKTVGFAEYLTASRYTSPELKRIVAGPLIRENPFIAKDRFPVLLKEGHGFFPLDPVSAIYARQTGIDLR